jgi:hypothetical protein
MKFFDPVEASMYFLIPRVLDQSLNSQEFHQIRSGHSFKNQMEGPMGAGWWRLGLEAWGLRTPAGRGTDWRAAASWEAHGGDGAGAGLETDVLVLLPVPAGHGALHAGALVADCVQLHAGFGGGDGTVHWVCLHASAHHGHTSLLWNCTVTKMWPGSRGSLGKIHPMKLEWDFISCQKKLNRNEHKQPYTYKD